MEWPDTRFVAKGVHLFYSAVELGNRLVLPTVYHCDIDQIMETAPVRHRHHVYINFHSQGSSWLYGVQQCMIVGANIFEILHPTI